MQSRYLIWLALGLCLSLCFGGNAVAQNAGDYHVKATFIAKVLHFVEWPAERHRTPETPIIVGVLGKDPFGQALDEALRGVRVRGRSVTIRRFESSNDALSSHLLFCAQTNQLDSTAMARLKDQSIFLVSDQEGFAARGGALEFYHEDHTVRFRVNTASLKHSRLKVSSKLLRLGKPIVNGEN